MFQTTNQPQMGAQEVGDAGIGQQDQEHQQEKDLGMMRVKMRQENQGMNISED